MITFKQSSAVLLTAIIGILSTFIPISSYANNLQDQKNEDIEISVSYKHHATDSSDTDWIVTCRGKVDYPHTSYTQRSRFNTHFNGRCFGATQHLTAFSPTYWSITWPYAVGSVALNSINGDRPPVQRALSISRQCIPDQIVNKGAMFAIMRVMIRTDDGQIRYGESKAWNQHAQKCSK